MDGHQHLHLLEHREVHHRREEPRGRLRRVPGAAQEHGHGSLHRDSAERAGRVLRKVRRTAAGKTSPPPGYVAGKASPPPRPPSPVSAKNRRFFGRGACRVSVFPLGLRACFVNREAEEAPRIPAGKTARPRRTCRRGRLKVRKGCGPLELSHFTAKERSACSVPSADD